VRIKDDTIIAAVELSQRYNMSFLADKAIDLMDEAASKHKSTPNPKLDVLDRIMQLNRSEAIKKMMKPN
jgi:ATP-dependent Clp protease ATP-binding subunit ClpA